MERDRWGLGEEPISHTMLSQCLEKLNPALALLKTHSRPLTFTAGREGGSVLYIGIRMLAPASNRSEIILEDVSFDLRLQDPCHMLVS